MRSTKISDSLGLANAPVNKSHPLTIRDLFLVLYILAAGATVLSGFKLFSWTLYLADPRITLETISMMLSIGWAVAFFVGPLIVARVGVKWGTFVAFSIALFGVLVAPLFEGNTLFIPIFVIGGLSVGFGGALWLVLKNTILPRLIKDTGISDTIIAALANIVFVVASLIGTVGGAALAERYGLDGNMVLIVLALSGVVFAGVFSDSLSSPRLPISDYITWVRNIVSEFFAPIVVTAGLWAVITALAQIFIEIGVREFKLSFAVAALVLVWATLGGIIGNIVSIAFQKQRFIAYRISLASLGVLVAVSTYLIDIIIASGNSLYLSVLAVIIGFVFGIAVNLMDWYYFLRLESSPYKTIGAAVYGLFASIAILGLMQSILVVRAIDLHLSFLVCAALVGGLYYISRGLRD
jgi:hypothetical protein